MTQIGHRVLEIDDENWRQQMLIICVMHLALVYVLEGLGRRITGLRLGFRSMTGFCCDWISFVFQSPLSSVTIEHVHETPHRKSKPISGVNFRTVYHRLYDRWAPSYAQYTPPTVEFSRVGVGGVNRIRI